MVPVVSGLFAGDGRRGMGRKGGGGGSGGVRDLR